jgi:hypothetical protein
MTIMRDIIPLQPSMDNQALSWVAQGGELAKVLGTIKSCPFKSSRLPREGWPGDDSGSFQLKWIWTNSRSWNLEGFQINMGLIWL